MLKLVRRPVTEFLGPEQRRGLKARVDAERALAADMSLTSEEKSKRIGQRWDDFRAGKTSRGTFEALWCELLAMAFNKCALCETPGPGTVEHLEEKSSAPSSAFDWPNLLPACDTCNRTRENSGMTAKPFDPSDAAVEPLDYFGWNEYGDFSPAPAHRGVVRDLVKMYGLHRLREERSTRIKTFRALLASLVREDGLNVETVEALRALLTATSAYLGPIRDYLLRPPTENDALLVRGALQCMPELWTLFQQWLRPPAWSPARWMIRPERPDDLPAIHAVHAASFPSDAEARLVDLLRAAGRLTVSLVAEAGGTVVGHVAFSPVTAASGAVGIGLAPVAVLEAHRRQGVAAELVRAGLEACRTAGFGWAVVLGKPAYYGRFGFRPAHDFGLSDEYGGGPAFQVLELSPGGLPAGAGLIRYAPEFAVVA